MGENRPVSLNHAPLTDFHSKSSKVFVGSWYNKMQSEFKLKRKNKTLTLRDYHFPPFLHINIGLSLLILDTVQLIYMYVCKFRHR